MIFSKPFYWVLNIKDHSLKKKEILSLVSQYSRHYTSQTQKGSFISNTDWDSKLRRHWFALSLSERDQLNYNKQSAFKEHKRVLLLIPLNIFYISLQCYYFEILFSGTMIQINYLHIII